MNPTFFETFNFVTICTAVVTGFLFGYFGFVPLVRRLVPDESAPPPSAKTAFVGTLVVVSIILGSVVTVFYAEQIATEIVTGGVHDDVYWRAIGRYAAFVVFLLTFALGVAIVVWQQYHRRTANQTGGTTVTNELHPDDLDEGPVGDDDGAKGDGVETVTEGAGEGAAWEADNDLGDKAEDDVQV